MASSTELRVTAGRETIAFTVNGRNVQVSCSPARRLSRVLREDLGLTGTKVGCDAGDCGACTVLLDGDPVCACLVAAGQVEGCAITTVEGLQHSEAGARLQESFLQAGAAQCGACTPGMLVAASALLARNQEPSESDVMDALGGVLCRCTGYRKIIAAVTSAAEAAGNTTAENAALKRCATQNHTLNGGTDKAVPSHSPFQDKVSAKYSHFQHNDISAKPAHLQSVGSRIARLDGVRKIDGTEIFGADEIPADALAVRVIRCPHDRARFELGDLEAFAREHDGILRVLTAKDVPGRDCYGVIPHCADQRVFAHREARHRGEAVAAVVGEAEAVEQMNPAEFPVTWTPLPALREIDEALAAGAAALHGHRQDNVLVRGRVVRGDVERALAESAITIEAEYDTGFVEHAYIEPEAGFARRVGDGVEIQACTQSPYMDRADIAAILGIAPEKVRIIPTAVGGGFGSKLDLSVQPFIALAAWHTGKTARMVYSRAESIVSTTKRHPARMRLRAGCSKDGRLTALDFAADFNTGAYSSWGPTVAARVPVHASGPYYVPHYRALTRAVHTNLVPAGAFRGFGVPQATIAQEQVYDELADRAGLDRLEFRILNALDNDTPTVTGQVMGAGVGIRACLEALRGEWQAARKRAADFRRQEGSRHTVLRRGVGVAGMWYGCGNTSLSNPSTVRIGLKRDGRIALHQGAVDIGQGSNTIVTQICADAVGVGVECFDLVSADTALTPDCGKTSASRQTFVTGKAAQMAGRKLREAIEELARGLKPQLQEKQEIAALKRGATQSAEADSTNGEELAVRNQGANQTHLELGESAVNVRGNGESRRVDLRTLPLDQYGYVITAEATFDPPTSKLDENGQGSPYAVYGYGAHMAEIEVDIELGTIRVLKVTAAHDVGRAINPTLIEGQIEGGVAQGLGMALMEEFFPGKGENLHDYLIPSVGDIPEVESILIEDPSPVGPFGAKGIGEQAVIPTAPAILNALHDAAGIRLRKIPATPDRVRAAILAKRGDARG